MKAEGWSCLHVSHIHRAPLFAEVKKTRESPKIVPFDPAFHGGLFQVVEDIGGEFDITAAAVQLEHTVFRLESSTG